MSDQKIVDLGNVADSDIVGKATVAMSPNKNLLQVIGKSGNVDPFQVTKKLEGNLEIWIHNE